MAADADPDVDLIVGERQEADLALGRELEAEELEAGDDSGNKELDADLDEQDEELAVA